MKYIIIVLVNSLFFTCKAQTPLPSTDLQNEVLIAFINQNFDFNDLFYLNKNVRQKKYPTSFSFSYNSLIDFYKKADSICNNSKDTLQLKFFCPAAFNRKKYVDLFDTNKLKYLEDTYDKDAVNSFVLGINLLSEQTPIIKKHSNKYYLQDDTSKIDNLLKEDTKSKEVPNLEIQGIYFLKDNNVAIIEYLMTKETFTNKIQYSILKKEKGIWWRMIGNISLK